jgi:CRP-like cAMP-binding protein
VAADFLGGRVHDRQRDPHRGDRFGAAAGRSQRQGRAALPRRIHSIDRREFLRLVSLARWVDCSPGEVILKKGQQISEAVVVITGDLEAILSGNSRLAIRPGQLIGDVSAYGGLASPVEVVARGTGTLAKWDLRHISEFTASRPELRANLLRIVAMDLAAKLHDVATAGPGLGTAYIESGPSPSGA